MPRRDDEEEEVIVSQGRSMNVQWIKCKTWR